MTKATHKKIKNCFFFLNCCSDSGKRFLKVLSFCYGLATVWNAIFVWLSNLLFKSKFYVPPDFTTASTNLSPENDWKMKAFKCKLSVDNRIILKRSVLIFHFEPFLRVFFFHITEKPCIRKPNDFSSPGNLAKRRINTKTFFIYLVSKRRQDIIEMLIFFIFFCRRGKNFIWMIKKHDGTTTCSLHNTEFCQSK